MCVCVCLRVCVLQLTSFEELSVQVGQAACDGVGEPAAADPVVGLDAQVAAQGALRVGGEERVEVRDEAGMKTDMGGIRERERDTGGGGWMR